MEYLDHYREHCNDFGNIATNLIANFPLERHLKFSVVCRAPLSTLTNTNV